MADPTLSTEEKVELMETALVGMVKLLEHQTTIIGQLQKQIADQSQQIAKLSEVSRMLLER